MYISIEIGLVVSERVGGVSEVGVAAYGENPKIGLKLFRNRQNCLEIDKIV
jgi:hypothetical protein